MPTVDGFTDTELLMPHPVYAWMGWVQVPSLSAATFAGIRPLLADAHGPAVEKYHALLATSTGT